MRTMTCVPVVTPKRVVRICSWALIAAALHLFPLTAAAQVPGREPPASGLSLVDQVLQFTYTLANAIGKAIVGAIQTILPQAAVPVDLIDPIGFLAVLTLFVLLAGIARRLAWIVVVAGWFLIAVRIALVILKR